MLLKIHDAVAVTETWLNNSYDQTAAIVAYKLFRKTDEEGVGEALFYIKKGRECEELSLKNGHRQEKLLSVRDQGNKGSLVVHIYFRPPDQEKPVDEDFFLQLQEALLSQAFILLGDFKQPDIC